MSLTQSAPEFARYRVVRELGRGAMGIVYCALDTQSGGQVALKTVRADNPAYIHHLKREFRALADASHPNLVGLYELAFEEPHWFFTMELLKGVHFGEWIRGVGANGGGAPSFSLGPNSACDSSLFADATGIAFELTATGEGDDFDRTQASGRRAGPAAALAVLDGRAPRPPVRASIERVRAALSQLIKGVHALHQRGLLHRDLKPTNVMVEPDGRVVLLDFGVVTETAKNERSLAGTLPYMAPEVLSGKAATPASDWYAVGVMLYEALTGYRPLSFAASQNAAGVREMSLPPDVSRLCRDVPMDLEAMCLGLLQREPRDRWTFARIAEVLDVNPVMISGDHAVTSGEFGFTGRELQIEELHQVAHESFRRGVRPVFVRGEAGFGKSAIVQFFLRQIADPDTMIVTGRCFEQETVPYKAVDSLIDAFVDRLMALTPADRASVLPDDAWRLKRLFPVFTRLKEISDPVIDETESLKPQEIRRRAFDTLGTLVANVSSIRRLIFFIDDLHWGDSDSLPLLRRMLSGSKSPRMMFVATCRAELEAESELLRRWFTAEHDQRLPETFFIDVGPLSNRESELLVGRLMASHDLSKSVIRRLHAEARGNPYLFKELAEHVRVSGAEGVARATFDDLMRAKVEALDSETKSLLELITLVGRPRRLDLLLEAVGIPTEGARRVAQLRAERLVSVSRKGSREFVECSNSRVAEAVRRRMEGYAVDNHWTAFAKVLQTDPDVDPDEVFDALRASGDVTKAGEFAEKAAEQAASALAFARSVAFFEYALNAQPARAVDARQRLLSRLAEALVADGRSGDAAARFEELAKMAPERESLDLRRRAGYYYLSSGKVDEGLKVMGTVLAAYGMRLPPSPGKAIFTLGLNRLRLSLRGLKLNDPSSSRDATLARERTDLCISLALSLGMVDVIRGSDFVTRSVLEALNFGDPEKAGIALAAEAGFRAAGGGAKKAAEVQALIDRAKQLAADSHSDYLGPHINESQCMVYYHTSDRLDLVLKHAELAVQELEGRVGRAFESATSQLYSIWALYYLGDFRVLSERVTRLIDESVARGDRYGEAVARTGVAAAAYLAQDRADECATHCTEMLAAWTSHHGLQMQHYWATFALVQAELYEAQGVAAYHRIVDAWPQFKRAMILGIDRVQCEAMHLRGRAGLAAAADTASPRRRREITRDVARQAKRLKRKPLQWMRALGVMLEAGLRALDGDQSGAVELFASAEQQLETVQMRLFALCARTARLQLDPSASEADRIGVDSKIRACGVARPDKMVRLFAPAPVAKRPLAG